MTVREIDLLCYMLHVWGGYFEKVIGAA